MSRKNESITLSLTQEEKANLEKIALEFGQTWGNKPNISKLMRAIASSELKVVRGGKTAKNRKSAQKSIIVIQNELNNLSELI